VLRFTCDRNIKERVFPPSRINLTAFLMELQRMDLDIGFELLYTYSTEMKCVHKMVIQYYFHKTPERNFCDKFKYF